MSILNVLLTATVLFTTSQAFKILVVFPIPGGSHSILGKGYVKHLLNAGHEVTYITPVPIENPPKNLHQVDVTDNFQVLDSAVFDIEKLMNKEIDVGAAHSFFDIMHTVSKATIMNRNVQYLLHDTKQEFDVVIAEWMFNEIYSGFASVYGCPLIWSSSMEPHHMVLSIIDEAPNTAYTSEVLSAEIPPYNFKQRVEKLWSYIRTKIAKWRISFVESETYEKGFQSAAIKRGRVLAPLSEASLNGSLMLGNSHVSLGQAIRLPQNYIPVAGYHIDKKNESLPNDLKKIMDDSKHGVIYFSMGSMLRSSKLPQVLKQGLLDMFGGLKQTVIWKFEEQLPNRPKNVHVVDWAPQQSILGHPNCVLFISHGGLLSTTETVYQGVPVIGIPMFADQFNNVDIAVQKGFAKRVDLDLQTPVNLKAAIDHILGDPRYKQKVKELSFIFRDRPVSPSAELVHWVEHVIKTRGALHLRSPALKLAWYQKMYLDLTAVIVAFLFILNIVIRKLFINKLFVDTEKKRI